jgi:hypothetical protein
MPPIILNQRDILPQFEASTVDGSTFRYADLWQHRNLVLIAPPDPLPSGAGRYFEALRARLADLRPDDSTLAVLAPDAGIVGRPTMAICDRWGEVITVIPLEPDVSAWPPVVEVMDWVNFVRSVCPECPP